MTIELTPVAEGEEPKIELAGLGLALSARDEGLVVNEVFEGGGGQEAGIAVGDIILAVDGKQTAELGFQESLQAIRGPVGTAVRLTVQSKAGGVRDVTAMRRKIRA
jgi:C-terminal processing protease CtpA/Prc